MAEIAGTCSRWRYYTRTSRRAATTPSDPHALLMFNSSLTRRILPTTSRLLKTKINSSSLPQLYPVPVRAMSSQIPKTMKAIRVCLSVSRKISLLADAVLQVEKTGGPEVNTLQDIPVPTPKDDEVLIKVQWT